jgi:hypothetical protein
MAHQEQVDFCLSVKNKFPEYFFNQFVLDLGSLDINGNNQYLFEDCHYLGVDLAQGKNVDILSKGHEVLLPDGTFDTVISTECFEHDVFYRLTLLNAVRLLKSGGLLLFSCATTGRPEHGTKLTTPTDAPFLQSLGNWADYYKNLDENDIRDALSVDDIFSQYQFSVCENTYDLYFWGIKKGEWNRRVDYSFQVVKPSLHVALAQANQVKELTLHIAKKNDQLSECCQLIKRLNEELGLLKSENNTLESRLAESEVLIAESNRQISILGQDIAQRDTYIQEISAMMLRMRRSISWRLTIPVRMAGRLVRGEFSVIVSLFNHYIATRRQKHPVTVVRKLFGLFFHTTHPFQLLTRKFQTLFRLIGSGQFSVIGDIIQCIVDNIMAEPIAIGSMTVDDISILCTQHTLYIAHLIENELAQAGLRASINFQYTQMSDTGQLYIVICPQFFPELPQNYLAFQMEQSINSRWFSENYFNILKKAISIFDYSVTNIEFLEKNNFQYQQLFYLPVGGFLNYANYLQNKGYRLNKAPSKIDVLFYGDPNCERRRHFLEQIKRKYQLVIVSEVFGEKLVNLIMSAKVIINVHYYENALLETTRIYEALSLGIPVISEASSDMSEHSRLEGIVNFTPIGDVGAMLEAIDLMLNEQPFYEQKITAISEFIQIDKTFSSYFKRYLLANDLISFDDYYHSVDFFPEAKFDVPRLCLTLTETIQRKRDFLSKDSFGFQVIEGVRHRKGWLGCGMSYKFMLRKLHEHGCDFAIICEDDVDFYDGFEQRLEKIIKYLKGIEQDWTLFSGLIAQLHPDTIITKVEEVDGIEYVYINKTVSMVMNIYSSTAIELIESWDQKNDDPYTNTIDRHIESNTEVIVITTLPFLVGHTEEQISSLWGFENTQYNEMIIDSQKLLKDKVDRFKMLRSNKSN